MADESWARWIHYRDRAPHIARWWVVEIFHLLGYRKHEPVEGRMRFSRRKSWALR